MLVSQYGLGAHTLHLVSRTMYVVCITPGNARVLGRQLTYAASLSPDHASCRLSSGWLGGGEEECMHYACMHELTIYMGLAVFSLHGRHVS